jgi:hypothetical protein
MIMLGILLRDYSLELADPKELSCAVDPQEHPLYTRVNRGPWGARPALTERHTVRNYARSPERHASPDRASGPEKATLAPCGNPYTKNGGR